MSMIIGVPEENTEVTERCDSINMLLACLTLHWHGTKAYLLEVASQTQLQHTPALTNYSNVVSTNLFEQ